MNRKAWMARGAVMSLARARSTRTLTNWPGEHGFQPGVGGYDLLGDGMSHGVEPTPVYFLALEARLGLAAFRASFFFSRMPFWMPRLRALM